MNSEIFEYLLKMTRLSNEFGVQQFATERVEDGYRCRGASEDRSIMILDTENVPSFDFASVGVVVDMFQSRIGVLDDPARAKVTPKYMKDDASSEIVSLVVQDKKKTKIEYRCMPVAKVIGPKHINDHKVYKFEIISDVCATAIRAIAAAKAEVVALVTNGEELKLVAGDESTGAITVELTPIVDFVEEHDGDELPIFKRIYPAKVFSTLLRKASGDDAVQFDITSTGLLYTKYQGVDIIVPSLKTTLGSR